MPEGTKSQGGGAAIHGGVNFQNRVAAWAMVRALAGFDARPLLVSVPTAISFETPHPADDLLLTAGPSPLACAFIQAKRGLNFSPLADSELASVFEQFAAQFSSAHAAPSPAATATLLPSEALILVTDPSASSRVRVGLRTVLDRCRDMSEDPVEARVARNADEAVIFKETRQHLIRAWKQMGAGELSEANLSSLLRCVHVAVLDVEPEGAHESNVLDLLRLAVLANPAQADVAWSFLIELAARFSASRSGITIADVRTNLLAAGIALRATWDYAADVDRLRAITARTIHDLADYSDLKVHGKSFKVSRLAAAEIAARAQKESLLVVGAPGAGKSGALYEFVNAAVISGADVICLSAEDLSAQTIHALRLELGLVHDVQDVLENWPGTAPAYLIVDSLDVLRTGRAADMLTKLFASIHSGRSRWRIVASIRKYDLRYSQKLQQAFAANKHEPAIATLVDTEFPRLAHVSVQPFSDEEIEVLTAQSESLQLLFRAANPTLRDLLRVPFNLRLATQLLDAGVSTADLSPIQTRLELLDRYWSERVLGSGGDSREAALRRVADEIIKTKSTRIERGTVYEPSHQTAFEQLLSRGVLVERTLLSGKPDHRQLSFSHNALADYAIASLSFPSDPHQFADMIVADPDLLLFGRPALITFFELLWAKDRERFWNLAFDFSSRQVVPAIGRIIPGSVLAEAISSPTDFLPLVDRLAEPGEQERSAVRLFGYYVRALLADPTVWRDEKRLAACCQLLDQAVSRAVSVLASPALSLLHAVTDRYVTLGKDDLAALGRTARRLLEFAWEHEIRDEWAVGLAIIDVCRTFAADPAASAALLRKSLEPDHLKQHGHSEMYRLAAHLDPIFAIDPHFAADAYTAVFSYEEESEQAVPLGGSTNRIMSLQTTPKQNYEQARWQLTQHFPVFIRRAPLQAAQVVVVVIAAYCHTHHRYERDAEPRNFSFRGRESAITDDYSYIWDQEWRSVRGEETRLLDLFFTHLEELAAPDGDDGTLHKLLDQLADGSRPAVIWRRLLLLGTKYPLTIGMYLADLASASPLLTALETQPNAIPFITHIHAIAPPSTKEEIERAILGLVSTATPQQKETAEDAKANLLAQIPPEAMVLEELRALAKAASSHTTGEAAQMHPAEDAEFAGGAFLPDDLSPVPRDRGERNAQAQSVAATQKRLSDFYSKYANATLTQAEAESILAVLRDAWRLLHHPESVNVDPQVLSNMADAFVLSGMCIARAEETTCHDEMGKFLQDAFASISAAGDDAVEGGGSGNRGARHWPSSFCRAEAAAGLITLAYNPSCATPDLIQRISELAGDPAIDVRFEIARRLFLLRRTAPSQMRHVLEMRVKTETTNRVIAALADSLGRLGQIENSSWCTTLLNDLLEKVLEGDEFNRTAREVLISALVGAHVWRGDELAGRILNGIADNSGRAPETASLIPFLIRAALTHGDINDKEQAVTRRRAIDLFARITNVAVAAFESAVAATSPDSEGVPLQQLAQLVHKLSQELYFASGLFEAKRSDPTRILTDRQIRFYSEIAPILGQLAPIGLPAVAYSNMQLLEGFVETNPRSVFLHIGTVVKAGRRGGYEYEQLAADLSVRLVEKYLSEQKELLATDPECRPVLREILDTFVEAGWAGAQQLCFRLHEIYE